MIGVLWKGGSSQVGCVMGVGVTRALFGNICEGHMDIVNDSHAVVSHRQ